MQETHFYHTSPTPTIFTSISQFTDPPQAHQRFLPETLPGRSPTYSTRYILLYPIYPTPGSPVPVSHQPSPSYLSSTIFRPHLHPNISASSHTFTLTAADYSSTSIPGFTSDVALPSDYWFYNRRTSKSDCSRTLNSLVRL